MLGNYIAQTSLNYKKYHPYCQRRPLIYWDVILVLLPAQLAGSNIGVLLSQIVPETVIIILALLVTIYALVKTYKKGMTYYKKESENFLTQHLLRLDTNDDSIRSGNKSLEIMNDELSIPSINRISSSENKVKLEVIFTYHCPTRLISCLFTYSFEVASDYVKSFIVYLDCICCLLYYYEKFSTLMFCRIFYYIGVVVYSADFNYMVECASHK